MIDFVLYASVSCMTESNHILPEFAVGIECDEIKRTCTAKYRQLNNSLKLSLWDAFGSHLFMNSSQDYTGHQRALIHEKNYSYELVLSENQIHAVQAVWSDS